MRKGQGITLIALVVTIIVLLILAGVSLSLIAGGDGILRKASNAVDENKIATAKEQVELKVAEHQTDFYQAKYVEKTNDGTKKEYISEKLVQGQETNDFYAEATEDGVVKVYDKDNRTGTPVVTGVILEDGSIKWDGEITDNSKENPDIQMVASQTITNDYVKGNLHVEITYQGNLSEITVNGKPVTAVPGANGVYTINQEITENGNYVIVAKDENGDYKRETIAVTDITEDMEIWNRADMENFRNKVNSGRTFEGKTAKVMADIDLEGSQNNQWTPIGNGSNFFKGTFEGNDKTISHVYYNQSNGQFFGLFGVLNVGTIKNVKVKDSNFTGKRLGGAICGHITGSGTVEKCVSDANTITGTGGEGIGGVVGSIWIGNGTGTGIVSKCYTTSTTIVSSQSYEVGGVIGYNYGIVKECFNKGTVKSSHVTVGGVAGGSYHTLINCYNAGKLEHTGSDTVGGIAGYVAKNGNSPASIDKAVVQNCYNIGTIVSGSGSGSKGGIIGNADSGSDSINNYWLENCGSGVTNGNAGYGYGASGSIKMSSTAMKQLANPPSTLGDAFVPDVQNQDGTWKYNNGYPILKWQVEE